jgi:hypothetical protein
MHGMARTCLCSPLGVAFFSRIKMIQELQLGALTLPEFA